MRGRASINSIRKKLDAWVDENHDCAGQTNPASLYPPPPFQLFCPIKEKLKETSRSKKGKNARWKKINMKPLASTVFVSFSLFNLLFSHLIDVLEALTLGPTHFIGRYSVYKWAPAVVFFTLWFFFFCFSPSLDSFVVKTCVGVALIVPRARIRPSVYFYMRFISSSHFSFSFSALGRDGARWTRLSLMTYLFYDSPPFASRSLFTICSDSFYRFSFFRVTIFLFLRAAGVAASPRQVLLPTYIRSYIENDFLFQFFLSLFFLNE